MLQKFNSQSKTGSKNHIRHSYNDNVVHGSQDSVGSQCRVGGYNDNVVHSSQDRVVIHCNVFYGDSSYNFSNDQRVNGTINPVNGETNPVNGTNNITDVNPFHSFDFSN
ncbi:hypothetical protein ACTFIW_003783 [Dictyostelium discoideum]